MRGGTLIIQSGMTPDGHLDDQGCLAPVSLLLGIFLSVPGQYAGAVACSCYPENSQEQEAERQAARKEPEREARVEADRALTEARTLVGNLVRDLSQAAVDDLEHALGQAGNRSDDITRSLDRAGQALDGNPLQPSITAARDAASNIRRALQPIHDRDYFTARERALAWAGDLTRIIDHARTDVTSLAWRP